MTYNFKDKRTNIDQLNNYMLAKTLSMFEYQNLPDSLPSVELERLLQIKGQAFICRADDGEIYAFTGGLGGEPDAYGRSTKFIVSNPHLKFNKTLSIGDDGVLITNDDLSLGLMPLYEKFHTLLVENDINMVLYGYNTRVKTLITAGDDKTKQSAETYLKKVIDGEVGVIGENSMFDGVKAHSNAASSSVSITSITEYHQYIKASLYNEVGLSSNFNMKRERLISSEVEQGEDSLFPFVYNMMKCRLDAIEKINKLFNLDIKVDFGSVWFFKNHELVDGVIDNNEPSNEPLNEPSNEPLKTPTETDISQADTVNDAIDLLNDVDLTDDDIKAVEELINELENKTDET